MGAKKNMNKDWHPELSDKAGSIRPHVHWAMKNCEGSVDKLLMFMENSVEHYKDNHVSRLVQLLTPDLALVTTEMGTIRSTLTPSHQIWIY